jgi:hypothetical protein
MRTARLLALALLAALPASATSYLPVTDEALVDQAPVIAVVEVQGSAPGQDGARPFTGYRVRVEKVLKGAMASSLRITVRVPGGARADGLKLRIWGAPRFASGERALLFLSPRVDGTYDILHLMLGAFHEIRIGSHRLAVRDLSEAQAISQQGELLRDFDRFVRWVVARSRGVRGRADYQVAATPALRQITEDFTFLSGIHQRWLEFDDGESVPWYAHQDGQSGLEGGGFAEFQTAIATWNDDPDSNIAYTYAGTTTDTTGFQDHDSVNAILFNDPNNEAPGSFSCPTPGTGSGVLAIGGTWLDDSTTPARIVNADIVTNNGAGCWFQDSNGSKKAEQIFAHELGHTLGIGHSCGDSRSGPCNNPILDQALMRATAHNDGRGAALNSDDRAAAFYLYGIPTATDFFTITPCRLVDTRNPDGPYGGPILNAQQTRTFSAAGQCGIPSTAAALAANVTTVATSSSGHLKVFPAGWPQPNTSVVNFSAAQTRSNNALLFLSGAPERAFAVFAGIPSESVHLIVDVNGYFE